MTMLDRVAAAMDRYYVSLWREMTGRGVWWLVVDRDKSGEEVFRGHSQEEAREFCRKANARAVVEAMREPDDAMKRDGAWTLAHHANSRASLPTIAGEMFVSMIDAALTEPGA